MRPPICFICRSQHSCELVQFADFRPLPRGVVGHPHGLEYFCADHIKAARALSGYPEDEALARLVKQFEGKQGGIWRRMLRFFGRR